jgi:hypothetical protein
MSSPTAITTDVRMRNVITLVQMAMESRQPVRRAQHLAEAQRQTGWALRSAVEECKDADTPWRTLAGSLELAHDALWRQYKAGGPVMAGSPYYQAGSRNDRRAFLLVVAFRTLDDGHLHVLAEDAVVGLDSFELPFEPGGPSPYRDRQLQYYVEPAPGISLADLGRSAGYTIRHHERGIVACLTEPAFNELFGPPTIGSQERLRWEAQAHARGLALASDATAT